MIIDSFKKIKDEDPENDIKDPTEEEIKAAFLEYDLDKSGNIDKKEIKKFIRKTLGLPVEVEDLIEKNKGSFHASAVVKEE